MSFQTSPSSRNPTTAKLPAFSIGGWDSQHRRTPKQTPSKPTPTMTKSSAASSDYEQVRLNTIRRNQDFLRKLGLLSPPASSAALKPKPAAAQRLPTPSSASGDLPLRRSSRLRGIKLALDQDREQEPLAPALATSSVFHYACHDGAPLGPVAATSASSQLLGFRVVGGMFCGPFAPKVYSLDVSSVNRRRFSLVAGGQGGLISVYDGQRDGSHAGAESSKTGKVIGPLMRWKGSPTWISGVKLVEGNPTLLVSTSDDGSVVVWDVKQQPVSPAAPSPPVVAKSAELHKEGIFGMDRFGCRIATASRDSSVGISRLTPAGKLVTEHSISGHHSAVIRGVCFGEENHYLADCGDDGRICILDTRLSKPCTITIESQIPCGVNTVEWSKSNGFLILSASREPFLRLYDIRSSGRQIHELRGHVANETATFRKFYRPCFVGRKTIATPGQGSGMISLYDADEGTLISQGAIGYDANLVMFEDDAKHPKLWAAGRQINQLLPLA